MEEKPMGMKEVRRNWAKAPPFLGAKKPSEKVSKRRSKDSINEKKMEEILKKYQGLENRIKQLTDEEGAA